MKSNIVRFVNFTFVSFIFIRTPENQIIPYIFPCPFQLRKIPKLPSTGFNLIMKGGPPDIYVSTPLRVG